MKISKSLFVYLFYLLNLVILPFGHAQQISHKILPEQLPLELGAGLITDHAMFSDLAHIGTVRGSQSAKDVELIKFVVEVLPNEPIRVYWINTKNINQHPKFMEKVGIPFQFSARGRSGSNASGKGSGNKNRERSGKGRGSKASSEQTADRGSRGSIAVQGRGSGKKIATLTDYSPTETQVVLRADMSYLAEETAPNGTLGLYTYNLEPYVNFELGALVFKAIENSLPIAKEKLAYRLSESVYTNQYPEYVSAGIAIYSDFEKFTALNEASSFGKLSYLSNESLPSSNDILIVKTLPNELPRVAGVISAVRQTPLSHVNLRAVQDKIPNAYIADVLTSEKINSLLGQYVKYQVSSDGYSLQPASNAEVEAYFNSLKAQNTPDLSRDLNQTKILPLTELNFASSVSVGAKAANLAVLKNIDFAAGTVPDGFAVPFYYYDKFMRHNGFYQQIDKLIADTALIADKPRLEAELSALRKRIKKAEAPAEMLAALEQVHNAYPTGASLRCRSSTNNEDLAHFSGAGLYDSFTHHIHEGHLAKSVKQVYASLWNFRAFEARELYGVDHKQVAMGVLIHPNFKGELANGVAVTKDVLYDTPDFYYVNAQHGEDLVTNPDALSTPEELLIGYQKSAGFKLLKPASNNKVVLINQELDQLRDYLALIHSRFANLYHVKPQQAFAMEIEFKVTADNQLVIKQARPWIF